MLIDMHAHRFDTHRPDWLAGAVSGFAAGAVLMVLELLWTALILDSNPWSTSHKIAAIVLGRDALQPMAEFSVGIVAVALVIHYLLGIFTGLVVAMLVTGFRFDTTFGMVLSVGAVLGLVIYVVNFYLLIAMFPWFADMGGTATLVAHLIFGLSAAAMYWKLGRIE